VVEFTNLFGSQESNAWSAVFSPDGTRILSPLDDSGAWLWDAETGEQIATLRGHDNRVRSAAFSPDGTRIVTASEDNTAPLWDANTGRKITILRGHGSDVNSAAFTADGARIVTASDDHTMRLWDEETGQEITRVTIEAGVTALAVRDADIALGDRLGRLHVFSIS
jgi:WD40 repeat protein